IVVGVVGRVLEAPLDPARHGIEREHARGPLVVAGTVFGVIVGTGIADALIDGLGLGIVGRRNPHGSAAVLPVLLAVLPRLVARLPGARDREGAPGLLAGIEVSCVDPAADAELSPGRADDADVANDERT